MSPPFGSEPAHAARNLRTINVLLSDTSTPLPTSIPSIVSLLYSSPVLETCATNPTPTTAQKRKSTGEDIDASAHLHRFRTRITTLLQSRSPQEKWAGVALAKASVESSFEMLAGNGEVWTRLMVPLLSRPEPPATHTLTIATLTRIFTILTASKPSIVRTVVMPNLPATISGILGILRSGSALAGEGSVEGTLAPGLEALRDLLRHHPVTFRPFVERVREVTLVVLSSGNTCAKLEGLAGDLFVSLHLCVTASRGGMTIAGGGGSGGSGNKAAAVAEEWSRSFKAVVSEIESLFNVLFRSVDEGRGTSRGSSATGQAGGTSAIGLTEWKGIPQGVDRAEMLLRLLQGFLNHPTDLQVVIPLGQITELTSRLFGIFPDSADVNVAVERSERESLFVRLPGLQCRGLDLLSAAVRRLGRLLAPLALLITEQVAYLFTETNWDAGVRTATYSLLANLISLFGTGLDKSTVQSLHAILSAACDDLLPTPAPAARTNLAAKVNGKRKQGEKHQEIHADSFLALQASASARLQQSGLVSAAETLIATALARLPTAHVRSEVRTKMDRTAILTANQGAMIASVLFPAGQRKGGSILPHLVGAGTDRLAIEGIVRPRLPVVWVGTRGAKERDEEVEVEVEVEEDEEEGSTSEDEPKITAPEPPTGAIPRVSSSDRDLEPSPKRQKMHTPPSIQSTPYNPPPSQEPTPIPSPPTQVLTTTAIATTTATTATATASTARPPTTHLAEQILANAKLEATDSDDEMIIPEIDMGESSSSDDGGEEGEEEEE